MRRSALSHRDLSKRPAGARNGWLGRRAAAAWCIGIAALSGCSLDPAYRRPAAPVSSVLPPMAGSSGAGSQARYVGWEEYFTDPGLRAVISMALNQNRDLRIAVSNVQAARAQFVIQRSDQMPTVSATAGETYSRTPGAVVGLPSNKVYDERYYSANIGISAWEVDLFGRSRSLTRAAFEQYLASDDHRRAVQISLIAEVATDYFTLAADRQLLTLAKETLASQRAALAVMQQRYQAGVISELDVQQANTAVQQALADVSEFMTRSLQSQNALNLVVGAAVPEDALPRGLSGSAGAMVDLAPDTTSDVLLARPDVLEAEHRLKAANADIGAARAAFFPRVTLTARAGHESPALSSLFNASTKSWLFAPDLALPIFAGGSNLANLRSQSEMHKAAVAQYEKTIQTAFREVADALARRGTISDELSAEMALVTASERSLKISTIHFDQGTDSYTDVYLSQRQFYVSQQGLVSTQLAQLVNAVETYRVLGGGDLAAGSKLSART